MTIDILKEIASSNPFLNNKTKDIAYFHITFLADKPQLEYIEKIKEHKYLPEEFELKEKAVYLYCPKGYGNTKLSNNFFESKLKVSATTRNWENNK